MREQLGRPRGPDGTLAAHTAATSILVVCRCRHDVRRLHRLTLPTSAKVVVASNDFSVHQDASKILGVHEVCFIDRMETMYSVADDVLRIREAINAWLESLSGNGDGVDRDLLFFERHAEGGMTTQRIQDALLLVRSYRDLFAVHKIDQVHLRRKLSSAWEDDLLVAAARASGVAVVERRSPGYRLGKWFDLVPINRHLFGSGTPVLMPAWVVRAARQVRLYFGLCRGWLTAREPRDASGKPTIAFLLGNSSDKQVENITALMQELRQRNRYRPLALCWGAVDGAAKVRRQGLPAMNLEAWFPWRRFLELRRRLRRLRRLARVSRERLRHHPALRYESVDLMAALEPSIDFFVHYEMPWRVCLKAAAEQYFARHVPAAVKTWGDTVLAFGAICRDLVRRLGTKQPLIFDYHPGVAWEWPYTEHGSDLYLAAGESEKELLLAEGVSPERVVVTGQARYDHLAAFRQTYDKHGSRKVLGVPLEERLYVFHALGYPVSGLESSREYFTVSAALIEFFSAGDRGVLLVKAHPAAPPNVIASLKGAVRASRGIFWFDQGMKPYHCINAADVVVTKYSGVGLEAMLLDVPLVTISLDGEMRFQKIFGDVPERFWAVEELLAFLRLLGENPQDRRSLEHRQSQRRPAFLARRFVRSERPAAELMADAVERALSAQGWCHV